MNAETLLHISQLAILIGAVIVALGSYGAWYFSNELQQRDHQQTQEQIATVKAAVEKLATNIENPKPVQLESAREKIETDIKNNFSQLQRDFPYGYAVLTIEGKDWFALPRNSQGEFHWDQTRILNFGPQHVSIMLPRYIDTTRNIRFAENSATIKRQAGAEFTPYSIAGIEFVIRVLSTTTEFLNVAVGVRPVRERPK
jgi:hypothetical protein